MIILKINESDELEGQQSFDLNVGFIDKSVKIIKKLSLIDFRLESKLSCSILHK